MRLDFEAKFMRNRFFLLNARHCLGINGTVLFVKLHFQDGGAANDSLVLAKCHIHRIPVVHKFVERLQIVILKAHLLGLAGHLYIYLFVLQSGLNK